MGGYLDKSWTNYKGILIPGGKGKGTLIAPGQGGQNPGKGTGGAGGGGGAVQTTWNPLDKNAAVTLSNGNLTASTGGTSGAVRATKGHDASGNWYFEVTCTDSSSSVGTCPGVGLISATLSEAPGRDSLGWGWFTSFAGSASQKLNNNVFTNFSTYSAMPFTIGVQVNAGSIIFWKNGVSAGTAFTGVSGIVYPMWGPYSSATGTRTATLNVGNSAFVGALPSGATAWG